MAIQMLVLPGHPASHTQTHRDELGSWARHVHFRNWVAVGVHLAQWIQTREHTVHTSGAELDVQVAASPQSSTLPPSKETPLSCALDFWESLSPSFPFQAQPLPGGGGYLVVHRDPVCWGTVV